MIKENTVKSVKSISAAVVKFPRTLIHAVVLGTVNFTFCLIGYIYIYIMWRGAWGP
jgi:hypothetical protein